MKCWEDFGSDFFISLSLLFHSLNSSIFFRCPSYVRCSNLLIILGRWSPPSIYWQAACAKYWEILDLLTRPRTPNFSICSYFSICIVSPKLTIFIAIMTASTSVTYPPSAALIKGGYYSSSVKCHHALLLMLINLTFGKVEKERIVSFCFLLFFLQIVSMVPLTQR